MFDPGQRRLAVLEAQAVLRRKPVYLDTETTGREPGAEIVEICVLDHDGTVLVSSLVRPLGGIPPAATQIHGITNGMVQDAPPWPKLWPRVAAALAGRAVAIYNADFDLPMLRYAHQRHGMRWELEDLHSVCIMRLYARFYGQYDYRRRSYRWQTLEDAALQCGLLLEAVHRAQADAILARAVLQYMAAKGETTV